MLETGLKGRQEEIVTEALSAPHIGSGEAKVFATPMMIALMEKTCRLSVQPFLEEGETTVGTHVDVSHEASTPLGMKVWVESELTEIDRRRLVFSVKAYDEKGLIGQGRPERFIVNSENFQSKAQSKLTPEVQTPHSSTLARSVL